MHMLKDVFTEDTYVEMILHSPGRTQEPFRTKAIWQPCKLTHQVTNWIQMLLNFRLSTCFLQVFFFHRLITTAGTSFAIINPNNI